MLSQKTKEKKLHRHAFKKALDWWVHSVEGSRHNVPQRQTSRDQMQKDVYKSDVISKTWPLIGTDFVDRVRISYRSYLYGTTLHK